MTFRVNNLQVPVEQPEGELPQRLAEKLCLRTGDIARYRILRKSLDARSRHDLRFVYSLAVDVAPDAKVPSLADVQAFSDASFDDPPAGADPMEHRPVIVGSGPAGLLAGYYLAKRGYQPLLIERGYPVKERVPAIRRFDAGGPFEGDNNYLFGEGGAGCFSDGKLTCRLTGPDVDWVLQAFVDCNARESILYEHRPHLGSNKLPMICRNFRRKIEAWGGEYRFGCRMEGIDVRDGRVVGVTTSSGDIPTQHLVLAIGHSARDTYEMLHALGVPLRPKAFQLGLRIEQPQLAVNQWKYGRREYEELLGAADYSLVAKGQRDVYSFCMCAGGVVIPSISEPGQFCTNGMSNSRHDTPFANSGLMITLEPHEFGSEHPLAGVELQRRYETLAFEQAGRDYLCPVQGASDFLAERRPRSETLASSYRRGTVPRELEPFLPPVVIRALREGLPIMDKKWRGKFLHEAVLHGPEMRGSSPIRIDRDRQTRVCGNVAGLYPVGEGAGYAGGIVSAAVDGLRSAREIVRRFAALVPTAS